MKVLGGVLPPRKRRLLRIRPAGSLSSLRPGWWSSTAAVLRLWSSMPSVPPWPHENRLSRVAIRPRTARDSVIAARATSRWSGVEPQMSAQTVSQLEAVVVGGGRPTP